MNELTSAPSVYLAFRSDSNLTQKANQYVTTAAGMMDKIMVLRQYSACNDAIGGHITLSQDLSYCPALIGRDGNIVFLFQFVEVLDELIDYEKIQRLIPGLSFRQITGAIAYLRKLAQFNVNNVDLDAFIDSTVVTDEGLLSNLRSALSVQEASVVLNIP